MAIVNTLNKLIEKYPNINYLQVNHNDCIVFKIEFKTNLKFYFVSYNAKNNILSLLHSKIAVF